MTEKSRQALPYFSLTLAMLLWASSFVALKLAFRGYHPMQVIFGRMFIASQPLFCGLHPCISKGRVATTRPEVPVDHGHL